ncbi:hypothetical protein J6590_107765 [Homalodisca vitripennis]|nr:hypothetical protein J6590_107765 [Homalodisca vitripennis]
MDIKSEEMDCKEKDRVQPSLIFKRYYLFPLLIFETPLVWEQQLLSPKYTEPIPVSSAKEKDLMYLLKAGVIPETYTDFVTGIPSLGLARDIVPYVVEEEEGIESLTEATKKKKGRHSKTDVKGKKPEKELSKEAKKTNLGAVFVLHTSGVSINLLFRSAHILYVQHGLI